VTRPIAIPSDKLAELAYQTLRRMILEKVLRTGGPVVEGRLVEELNISRTPLREALLRLEGEGLLVRGGGRSYSVRYVSAQEYFQTMKVRELLEMEAIGLAMGKIDSRQIEQLIKKLKSLGKGQQEPAHWQIDDQVHTMYAHASGNPVLARLIEQVRTHSRLFELVSPFNRIEEDKAEHLAILEAYLSGDAEAARNSVRTHLQNLRLFVLDRIS
jgi:DNA-binding GntR family transcriptional regulator